MEGVGEVSALERLAEAVLDGRVRFEVAYSTNGFGIPSGASIYIDVDPVLDDDIEEEVDLGE